MIKDKEHILFLLQNGIGFGHFKLALTIASKFDLTKYEITFMTQAKSTRIFEGYSFKVINIPPIYSLKTNNEVLVIHSLVNRMIEALAPDLVIEDTYPDDFYLNLPSLLYVPKLLIVNRLMAVEFENYYYSGKLSQYSWLLFLKTKKEFVSELTSQEVKNYVDYSNRIFWCKEVFNEPSGALCSLVKEKYDFASYEKNIVVNCGAGGWHIGENICRLIFEKLIDVANFYSACGLKYQFILLTGPYSDYLREPLLKRAHNDTYITIIDFEDHADALFHEADLVVLRPGYNSTMEALAGNGHVLLLPGISYLEEQTEWCEELKAKYDIDYLHVSSLNRIQEKIDHIFQKGIKERQIENHVNEAIQSIVAALNNPLPNRTFATLTISKDKNTDKQYDQVISKLRSLGIGWCSKVTISDDKCEIPIINTGMSQEAFRNLRVMAVYLDEKMDNPPLSFYEERYHFRDLGCIMIPITEFVIHGSFQMDCKRFSYILRNPGLFSSYINVHIGKVQNQDVLDFLNWLSQLISEERIIPTEIIMMLAQETDTHLLQHKFNHYKPEITKLT